MNILLITNDKTLIQANHIYDIENSIIVGIQMLDEYDYLAIDEKNLYIEENTLETLDSFTNKVIILTSSSYKNFITISKYDFINGDFELNTYEKTFNTSNENISLSDESDESEYSLVEYMERLAKNNNISTVVTDLEKENKEYRNRLYSIIPNYMIIKILRSTNSFIKKELVKYKYSSVKTNLKLKIKNIIQRESPPGKI